MTVGQQRKAMKKLNSSPLFVWHKKTEKQKKIATQCETTEKKKKRLLREEFQTLKKRREESIANRSVFLLQKSSEREEEIIRSSGSSLNQNVNLINSDFEKREKDFEFHHIKLGAEIRLREGRPKLNVSKRNKPGCIQVFELDVKNLLQSKTYLELEELKTDIDSQMRSGAAKVVEYWEAVLKHLRFYMAMAFIKEEICLCDAGSRMDVVRALSLEPTLCKEDIINPLATQEQEQGAAAGSHSPQLLHCHDEYEVHDPIEDMAILEQKRITVMKEQESRADVDM
ncbi:hypothetical protein LguiA_025449 [Lonicera macranthoides]